MTKNHQKSKSEEDKVGDGVYSPAVCMPYKTIITILKIEINSCKTRLLISLYNDHAISDQYQIYEKPIKNKESALIFSGHSI